MAAKNAPARVSPATQARMTRQSQRRQEALALLASLDCLRSLPPTELVILFDLGVFRAFAAGATIFGKQKHADFTCFVLRGSLKLCMHNKDGHELLMGILGPGDCCGEGPIFGDFFRRMSAQATSGCYVFQIPLADLRESLSTLPVFAETLRQIYQRRLVESTVARIPLLSRLLPVERLALASTLQPATFSRGSLIITQDDPADALYLIESGQVTVEQDGRTVATLGEGDFFGEIALLTNQPHRANVRAMTATAVLALPSADFHYLLRERPDLEANLRTVIEQRTRHNAAIRANQAVARDLNQAVERGLLRGTHLLVRTPNLCPPGCQICEEACVGRHGHQRLALNGTPINGFDVLDACRQCSVGPECVEVCPEFAFERSDEGILTITDACNGCGDCVSACPYHVITSIAQETPLFVRSPLWSLWHYLRTRLRIRTLSTPHSIQRADKCDLCYGHPDQACITACPIGVLRLVPVEEIFPL